MNFNKLWFLWKPTQFRLGTISENVCIGDYYLCAKFHACIKKCTIHLKFLAKPPDYQDLDIIMIVWFSWIFSICDPRLSPKNDPRSVGMPFTSNWKVIKIVDVRVHSSSALIFP